MRAVMYAARQIVIATSAGREIPRIPSMAAAMQTTHTSSPDSTVSTEAAKIAMASASVYQRARSRVARLATATQQIAIVRNELIGNASRTIGANVCEPVSTASASGITAASRAVLGRISRTHNTISSATCTT